MDYRATYDRANLDVRTAITFVPEVKQAKSGGLCCSVFTKHCSC